MSASTQAAPRQISFGRFPTTLAAMALVVLLAVMVAIVALNGTKASSSAATSGFGHGPGDWYYVAPAAAPGAGAAPAAHDTDKDITTWKPSLIPQVGGFGGPRLPGANTDQLKDDTYVGQPTNRGGHNGTRRPQ